MSALRSNEESEPLTLTVLGCGTMGIAILSGIFTSLDEMEAPRIFKAPLSRSNSGTSTPADIIPSRLPNKFIACVRRPESAKRIKQELSAHTDYISVVQNDNVSACEQADVILLGCKPAMVKDVLAAEGMREALKGKLLISICAGVLVSQIETALYGDVLANMEDSEGLCTVVRAMPNTAARIRESMTVIATSLPPLRAETSVLVKWICTRIGKVVELPESLIDVGTALCGSGPALFALMLEAMIDGAVAMGFPRAEAIAAAAQTMRGTSGLVLGGQHPALLRDQVTTPGGCTIGGLLVLEEGRVRGTVARAVREATVVASQLGKGVQGVNGTRF